MTTIEWREQADRSGVRARLGHAYSALSSRLLVLPVLVSLVLYCALFLLLRGTSFRLTQTLTLWRFKSLGVLSDLLTPTSLVTAGWRTDQARIHEFLYMAIAVALVLAWAFALWLARPGGQGLRLRWILAPILIFSLPLMYLPGMFSGDLYLYMFYGRMIATYDVNPILVAPNQFAADPHLGWVYWKWLPAAYGPVWLLYSGLLSGLAGESLWANIFTYKTGVLLLHLLATVVVYRFLKSARPQLATWGAIFYGWNPLVLFETVGSAHNDVMVALFVGLGLLTALTRRWPYAVFFIVAAAMVKLMALLLLPALVLAWLQSLPTVRQRVRAGLTALVVAVGGGLALYAPLWGGTALLDNVRENPAAREYQNSLWELLILRFISPELNPMKPVYSPDLDLVRNVLFFAVYGFLLLRVWRGHDLMDTMIWIWFAYFVFAAWIWPWYFVQVIPIAALRGPSRTALLVGGLTLGGMLFWLGWPDPALPAAPWFHNYRAVLMFAPALLLVLWPLRRRYSERGAGRGAALTVDRAFTQSGRAT